MTNPTPNDSALVFDEAAVLTALTELNDGDLFDICYTSFREGARWQFEQMLVQLEQQKYAPGIELQEKLNQIGRLEAENASLKTCKQLLNEPVPEAIIHETIKRLESWGYHVSNRDQFKEMALEREIKKLKEVISMQREALEFISKNPIWAHETNQELCLTYGNFTVEHAKKALAKADELMKGKTCNN